MAWIAEIIFGLITIGSFFLFGKNLWAIRKNILLGKPADLSGDTGKMEAGCSISIWSTKNVQKSISSHFALICLCRFYHYQY